MELSIFYCWPLFLSMILKLKMPLDGMNEKKNVNDTFLQYPLTITVTCFDYWVSICINHNLCTLTAVSCCYGIFLSLQWMLHLADGQLTPCCCESPWSLIFPARVCCWKVKVLHIQYLMLPHLFALNFNGIQRYQRTYRFWDRWTKAAYNGGCCLNSLMR